MNEEVDIPTEEIVPVEIYRVEHAPYDESRVDSRGESEEYSSDSDELSVELFEDKITRQVFRERVPVSKPETMHDKVLDVVSRKEIPEPVFRSEIVVHLLPYQLVIHGDNVGTIITTFQRRRYDIRAHSQFVSRATVKCQTADLTMPLRQTPAKSYVSVRCLTLSDNWKKLESTKLQSSTTNIYYLTRKHYAMTNVYLKFSLTEHSCKMGNLRKTQQIDPNGNLDIVFSEQSMSSVYRYKIKITTKKETKTCKDDSEKTEIITRRTVFREIEKNLEESQESGATPEIEEEVVISEPEPYVPEESVPEWEPAAVESEDETDHVERRVVRRPVVEVTSRKVYRSVQPLTATEVEREEVPVVEEVLEEPAGDVVFEESYPQDLDLFEEPEPETVPEEETVETTRRQVFRVKEVEKPREEEEEEEEEEETTSKVSIRKTMTIRKKIVKKIIYLPDGSQSVVEEEVPADEVTDVPEEVTRNRRRTVVRKEQEAVTRRSVYRRLTTKEEPVEEKVTESVAVLPAPRRVERLFVRRILRKQDGTERLLDKSESVIPVETVPAFEEDEASREEEEEATEGYIVRKVIRRPMFVTSQRTVIRRLHVREDGGEDEVEAGVVEDSTPVETSEPTVTHRTVRRIVGGRKADDIDERIPLEIVRTDRPEPDAADDLEVEGEVKRTVRRRSITRTQRRVVRRIVERPDGKEEPVEDEVMLPVEAVGYRVVRRRIVKADQTEEVIDRPEYSLPETDEAREVVEEVKDEETGMERRVIRRPVPVVTVRKVYRTIILTEAGEEVSTDEKVEEKDVAVLPEEPEPEMKPVEELRVVKRREPDVVSRRQVFRRITSVKEVEQEPVAVRRPVVEDIEAEIPEPETVEEVEALPEPEEEEEEYRLRRVVRRPVHVVSRRTVIRKFEAASDEHAGVVEEGKEDVGEAIYPRRVVFRRAVLQPEPKVEEEVVISEPEPYVPEESVPEWEPAAVESEDETDHVERRVVRRPVVEVTSRKVYRSVQPLTATEVEREEVPVVEEVLEEPAGDVVFEESYPQDLDLFEEPEPETVPEEETVETTRRQVFRVKEVEKPREEEEEEEEEEETTSKVSIRKTVTIRKKIVKKIIYLPDGSQSVVEEEVPADEVTDVPEEVTHSRRRTVVRKEQEAVTRRSVYRRLTAKEEPVEEKVTESVAVLPAPRRVERLFVRRILRKQDGTERLLDKSESVIPVETVPAFEEDEASREEEEEATEGYIVRKVIRRPMFVTSQRTVIRRLHVREDGGEDEVEAGVVEDSTPVETSEPTVTHRTVRRIVGGRKADDIDERIPLEIVRTDRPEPDAAEDLEVEGEVKRTVRRRSITRTQRRVVRRIVERPDGKEEPVEDEVMLPVEAVGYRVVRRRIVKADQTEEVIDRPEYSLPETDEAREVVEEVKDEETGMERRVIRRPVPVVTVRKVYRTIILTEAGEEVSTDEKVEEKDVAVLPEEPEPEMKPVEELRVVKRREPDVVSRRQVFRRITSVKEVDQEPVAVRRPVVEDIEAEIPEPETVEEVEALPEPEEEEEEYRLRRVVRRPVHVVSRRTVIRKFEAASDEHAGVVEEGKEDVGEAIYPRRVVFRRAVLQPEPKVEEEVVISEPEPYVPEESVPEWEPAAVESEDETDHVERRVVRRPVVEVTSRKVYRSVQPLTATEVEREEVPVVEEVLEEPAGDVVFEESYPQDLDLFEEPEPETVPEEETVETTRRQVFRVKEVEKPREEEEEEEEEEETTSKVSIRKTVTIRKKIVKKIIYLPDGSQSVVEEEVPADEVTDVPEEVTHSRRRTVVRKEQEAVTRRSVYRRLTAKEEPVEEKVTESVAVLPAPRRVERLFVRRILRKQDGTERLLDKSESVIPVETVPAFEEDEASREEEEEATEGYIVRKVIRRPMFVTSQRTVIRRLHVREDGGEDEVEAGVVEDSTPVETSEPTVTHRTVRRIVGGRKADDIDERIPLEIVRTDRPEPDAAEDLEVEGEVKRTVRRRSITRTQRRVVRRIVERPDGKEEPVEDEVMLPVEAVGYRVVRRRIVKADQTEEVIDRPEYSLPETDEAREVVEEVKDEETGMERRVIRRPVPVVTVRKVYRTIILTEAGEEVSTDEKVEEKDVAVLPEEPEPEMKPVEELRVVKRREPDVVSRRQVFRRITSVKEVEQEPVAVRRPVVEDIEAEIPEPETVEEVEALPEPEEEEEEYRLRRVVRRPVHVVSRRTVIRKFEAASDEHAGVVEEGKEDVGEAIYPRRVVFRRAVLQPEPKVEEEVVISEPEPYVPEESVPEWEPAAVESEDETDHVERRVVRRPVVEVTSRKVYRSVQPLTATEVEREEVPVVEEVLEEPAGDVVFEESYPQDLDLFEEPEPETVPEEETVETTRRQVFRVKEVEKPREEEEEEEEEEETTSKVSIRKTVTIRKKIVKKIIYLPDGSQSVVEEEVPADEVTDVPEEVTHSRRRTVVRKEQEAVTRRSVYRRLTAKEEPVEEKVTESVAVLPAPRRVERLFVRRILRKQDGTERLLDKSESVIPVETVPAFEEDEASREEEEEATEGYIVRKVIRRPMFVTSQRTVIRRLHVREDGGEDEVEAGVVEDSTPVETSEPTVTHRTVRRIVGGRKADDIDERIPLEIVRTDRPEPDAAEDLEVEGEVKRTVRRRSITRTQRRVVRRIVERPDGKEEPVEDEVMLPVEAVGYRVVRRRIVKADQTEEVIDRPEYSLPETDEAREVVEEVKDEETGMERRVIRRPVPVVTVRKVYRTIILTEAGEEVSTDEKVEEKDVAVLPEEPEPEMKPVEELRVVKRREPDVVSRRQVFRRITSVKEVDQEPVAVRRPVVEDIEAEIPEPETVEEVEALPEPEEEEEEYRLRRVVRRPVHVVSRRTVIRKFEAASDEHAGVVEEGKEDVGEAIYPRRVVFRRAVLQPEPKVEEEVVISEPEPYVPEESVPEWEPAAVESEDETDHVERRVVRRPVVEVTSRKVYRSVQPLTATEVEREEVPVVEEVLEEPAGDVVFEESYPQDLDLFEEPEPETVPEEETVETTRRQVFRVKEVEKPREEEEEEEEEEETTSKVSIRKTVTIRKKIVKKIIYLPDGSQSVVEEEVPADEVTDVPEEVTHSRRRTVVRKEQEAVTRRSVYRRLTAKEEPVEEKVTESVAVLPAPRRVERLFVRRILRKQDGTERLLDKSESVIPVETVPAFEEDEASREEEEEATEGYIVRKVIRRPMFVTSQRTVIRRLHVREDGGEDEVEAGVVEDSTPVETSEPTVTHRTVRRIVGGRKADDIDERIPLEIVRTDRPEPDAAEDLEVEGEVKRTVRRRSITRTQRRVVRRIVERPDGKEEPVEDEVMLPVEAVGYRVVRRRIVKADQTEEVIDRPEYSLPETDEAREVVEEVKDEETGMERRVIRRPVPVVTVRKVYRTIILTEAGEEVSTDEKVEEKDVAVLPEEPEPEMKPVEELRVVKRREPDVVSRRQVFRRITSVKEVDQEPVAVRRPVVEDIEAEIPEPETVEEVEALPEPEEEEEEYRLRRVVRRPVHVVSRRTVIRKFEAASDEHAGVVEEGKEDVGEAIYPRRVVFRRAVLQPEPKVEEEVVISEPEPYVPEESVPEWEPAAVESEDETDHVERRVVRRPVVEVTSRKVYRSVQPLTATEVEREEVPVVEEVLEEPAGDVVFEESYPQDLDLFEEPEPETVPEEETVETTRRQVFRVKEVEKPREEEEEEEEEEETTSKVSIRKTVTIRKKIVKKIIYLPDGSQSVVEEEVPADEVTDVPEEVTHSRRRTVVRKEQEAVTRRSVYRRLTAKEEPVEEKVTESVAVLPAPRRVERLFVRRILRKQDGTERLLDKSESVIPVETVPAFEEDEASREEEEEATEGYIVRKVIRRPMFVTSQRTVIRRLHVREDGGEDEVEAGVVEDSTPVETSEPTVTHRTVRRIVGGRKADDIDERIPLEIVRTDRPEPDAAEDLEVEGEVKRTVRRRSITRTQRRVVRRIVERPDGKEEPVEDEVMLPVEAVGYRVVRRRIVKADQTEEVIDRPEYSLPETDEAREVVEEVKDEETGMERRVIRRPVPVVTVRKVYRTIILTEAGEEVSTDEKVEEKDVAVLPEEPEPEMKPVEELRVVKRREPDVVSRRQVFRRITSVKEVDQEPVAVRRPVVEDIEAEIPEPETVEEVEALPEPEEEEEEYRLRRVVRRPVHVVSRRTVIRKFEAASDEHAGVVEEGKEDVGEAIYPRRVVFRRAVLQPEPKVEEEVVISEPEPYVPEESVPEWEPAAGESEDETDHVERRVVRRPVVKVTSRKVYRSVQPLTATDVEREEVPEVEEVLEEPAGDVVFEESYPQDLDLFEEPEPETVPEEETVETTRRQVFRVKEVDKPREEEEEEEEEEETTSKVSIHKTVTIRKKIVKKLIYLPDGTQSVVEEEVPADEVTDVPEEVTRSRRRTVVRKEQKAVTRRSVYRRLTAKEEPVEEEVTESVAVLPAPRRVERLFVRRILRKQDGTERLLDKSESVIPVETVPAFEEDEASREEEEEATEGYIVRKVIRRPMFVTSQRTVIRRLHVREDGGEDEVEAGVVEDSTPVETSEPTVTHRTVRRIVGGRKADDIDERIPLEIVRTDRPETDAAEDLEVEGEVKRTVRRRSITRTQRRVVRRIVEKPDGKEEPVEDEVMLPVEAVGYRVVRRRIVKADQTEEVIDRPEYSLPETDEAREVVEEVKDEETGMERRVIRRPVPVVTVKKVYRTIILTEAGEEVSTDEKVEEKDVAVLPEEPEPEMKPVEELRVVKRREPDVVSRRQVFRRITSVKEVDQEPVAVRRPVVEDIEAEIPEPETVEEVEALPEPEEEEEEYRLRRVVRRPVHVVSRRTVIRKFEAASDEHAGVVEEGKEDVGEAIYPRRVVFRRAVLQPEPKVEEEVVISEPEPYVPEESVPEWEPAAVESEDETDHVERRVVRRPVVEVTSRKVYRSVQPLTATEVEREEVPVVEEVLEEPAGDVVFEESYPQDLDLFEEPEPETVPEEETVETTRRQVFRVKEVEKPREEEEEEEEEEETTSKVSIRKTVTIRKKIVKKIIYLPDGSQSVVEEEVPADEVTDVPEEVTRSRRRTVVRKEQEAVTRRSVYRRLTAKEEPVEEKVTESVAVLPAPRRVERLFVRRILRKQDGTERLLDKSESVIPVETVPAFEEDEASREEEEEATEGYIVRKVIRRPMFVTSQRTVIRRLHVREDGGEDEVEAGVVEDSTPVETSEPTVTHRTVRRIVGGRKADDIDERIPLEIVRTDRPEPDAADDLEVEGEVKRTVRRRSITRTQRRAVRRIVERPDGKEEPVEDEVILPVEAVGYRVVRRRIVKADQTEEVIDRPEYSLPETDEAREVVEEVKDEETGMERRVIRRPVPVVTVRKVYRTIILTEAGEEVSTDEKVEEKDVAVLPEEPEPEMKPVEELRVVKRREPDVVSRRQVFRRITSVKEVDQEPVAVRRPVVEEIEAEIPEPETVEEVEALPEPEEEEEEYRLRRVVRRPVHVVSRRTVIRKFEAASDEHAGVVEEGKEDVGEAIYPRRVVFRRAVLQPEPKVEEEVVISEPEPYVPEESVPEWEPAAVESEDETDHVERRVVRPPVVEVTSRKVYRSVQPLTATEVEREEVPVVEEVLEEPAGDVVFEESYPQDLDLFEEPEPETVPEEETVETTRRQVFRVKEVEKPREEEEEEEEEEETTSKVSIRKTVTIRKKIVKKIIYLPDGSQSVVEEEVPADEVTDVPEEVTRSRRRTVVRKEQEAVTRRSVYRRLTAKEEPVEEKVTESVAVLPAPRRVERLFVRRILSIQDGTERLLDKSESVIPVETVPAFEEDEASREEEEEATEGYIVRKVIRRPMFVTSQRTVIRRLHVREDGGEDEVEAGVVEDSTPVETSEPTVTHRTVRRIVGGRKADDIDERIPLEIVRTDRPEPDAAEDLEVEGEVKRTVRRRSITRTQRRVVRRIVERPDGKEEPVEDEVMLPVEAVGYRVVRRRIVKADQTEEVIDRPEYSLPETDEAREVVEEVKDEETGMERRVIRRPVPVVTVRKVYRTIILTEAGEEVSTDEKVEEKDVAVLPEEPEPEMKPVEELRVVKRREPDVVSRRQVFRRITSVKEVDQEPVAVRRPVVEDIEAEIPEPETVEEVEALPEPEEEEEEYRLRRVVRRPVHVVSRRTVIRKFEAASDEHAGVVEEGKEDVGEAIYPRRVVFRRAVLQPEPKVEEEVVISEPEPYVPEESVPEWEPAAVESEDETDHVERRVVRRPVVEVTSRKVYRSVQPLTATEVEREEVPVVEEVLEELAGDVVFEESYPQDLDLFEEPEPETVPEEETVETTRRQVFRVKEVEKSREEEEEEEEEEETTSKASIRKTVTIRKKIVKKIIYLPDGSQSVVEEEVPADEVTDVPEEVTRSRRRTVVRKEQEAVTRRSVYRRLMTNEEPVEEKVTESVAVLPAPRRVERLFVRRILRKQDGTERLLDKSESVIPVETVPAFEEDEASREEEEEATEGYIVRKVIRRPMFVTSQRTVIRRLHVREDGGEDEVEAGVVEDSTPVETSEPTVTHRTVRRLVGGRKADDIDERIPLEIVRTDRPEPDAAEDLEVEGEVKRTVRRRSITRTQRRVVRRIGERPDGKEEPVEDEVILPVEAVGYRVVRRRIVKADQTEEVIDRPEYSLPETDEAREVVEEVKDEETGMERRVIRRPVPVVTVRKVYRTIILTEAGEEVSTDEKVEEKDVAVLPEEPEPEMKPVEELRVVKRREPDVVSRRQVFRRITSVKEVDQEPVAVRRPVVEDIEAEIPEPETVEEVEALPEPEEEEEEYRLRRVVRRPVHVVSRRTVIRKFEAASDEHAGVVEEGKEDVGEAIYPRRVVFRRAVLQPEPKVEEEVVISEPEPYVPEESVPEWEPAAVESEDETDHVERRVVRRPVVEVTSRKVYRSVQPLTATEVEREEMPVVEEVLEEPAGDVVFEESYPQDLDLFEEPEPETVPEEETVETTRRQVFRVKEVEKPREEEEEEEEEEETTSKVSIRKTVTIRKKIVKKIIYLPDGSQSVVEEEVPADEVTDVPEEVTRSRRRTVVRKEQEAVTRRSVYRRLMTNEEPVEKKVTESVAVLPAPRRVERLFVRRILRKQDGTERLLDKSESVIPVETVPAFEEDEASREEEEEATEGYIVRKVIRRPMFVTSQRTVIRRLHVREDGGEDEVEAGVVEDSTPVETSEPTVTHRTVRRIVGGRKADDIDERIPLEIVRTDRPEPDAADDLEVEGEVKRTVRRRSITRTQRRVVRRIVERPDGKEEPVEDEVMLPVEAVGYRVVRRRIVKADQTEEVIDRPEYSLPETDEAREVVEEAKDEETGMERRVIRRPVPVVTVKKVYRTIILTEAGEEVSTDEKVEEKDVAVLPEEPEPEMKPVEELRVVKRREPDVVSRRQVFRRITSVKEVEQEPVAVRRPVVEDIEAEIPEPETVEEVEALPEPEEEEEEYRLRRVVRRPVHVVSRRSVIRKFEAASDEHAGVVEEGKEDVGEAIYPRRVVFRRAVLQPEPKVEEEVVISEPEPYVPEESVPEWEPAAVESEDETDHVERRVVRRPVVEVTSRKVYRSVQPLTATEVEREEVPVVEEVLEEPAGDVVFEESYPQDLDLFEEPEPETVPEEETVETTRRQVYRVLKSVDGQRLPVFSTSISLTSIRRDIDDGRHSPDESDFPLDKSPVVTRRVIRRIVAAPKEMSSIDSSVEIPPTDKLVTIIRPVSSPELMEDGDASPVEEVRTKRTVFRTTQSPTPQVFVSTVDEIPADSVIASENVFSVAETEIEPEVFPASILRKVRRRSLPDISRRSVLRTIESFVKPSEPVEIEEMPPSQEYTEITQDDYVRAEAREQRISKISKRTFVYRKAIVTYKTVLIRKYVNEFGEIIGDVDESDNEEEHMSMGFSRFHDGDDDDDRRGHGKCLSEASKSSFSLHYFSAYL